MRVCFIDVGHWHSHYYYEGAASAGIEIAAVSDRKHQVAERVAGELGCKGYGDYETMVEREKPDFVFALGRHCDMAATARYLLDRKIPFGMEKPMGLTSAEVEPLAEQARRQNAFVAVPLTFRQTPWVHKVLELERPQLDFSSVCLRFTTGPVSRYFKAGCEWILTKQEAGGGCALNLGIHLTDLFTYLTHKTPKRLWATINSRANGVEVEDFSSIIMEAEDGTSGRVENGYTIPGGTKGMGLECVLRGRQGYYEVREQEMLWIDMYGRHEHVPGPTNQTYFYTQFVKHCLDALRDGRPPIADIHDNLAAFKVVEAAYKSAATKQVVEL